VISALDAAQSEWLTSQWAALPEESRVDVDGVEIACRGWNLAAHDLPGIVLVHGFRAHARWWDHIAPSLADRHRVIALDLSGMGDSGWRTTYSRVQHGREVTAVARAYGFSRPIVIAHSYGGIVSMTEAQAQPDGFSRLIVVDSALPTPVDIRNAVNERPLRVYPSREAALERYVLRPPGAWPNPDILAYVARHSVGETEAGWQWKFDPALAAPLNGERDYRKHLLGISTPAAFVHGDRSEILTPERLAQLPLMLTRAGPPIAIPACHHHIPVEQPLALVAVLRSLLAQEVVA
jgi:pimeloyl-ACP methyl ester carboxylesterase